MADDFHIYRRKSLPHWRISSAAYFVTWRLERRQAALSPTERDMVMDAILHHRGSRYDLDAYVVMDDHVHVVLTTIPPWTLEQTVQGWKSFTAHELVRAGRRPPVWQREYLDRIVRDEDELCQKVTYVARNPFKRWPDLDLYPWVFPTE
ncbi:MAG TPA: transposase [Armatimonadota bacterium]